MLFRSYKEGDPSMKVYIVTSGEFQESCKVSIDQGLNDEDCLPLLSEETRRINSFKANFLPKKRTKGALHMRNVNVKI